MTTLYIDRKGAEIDVEGDTVVVRTDGERRGTIPLKPLERVVVASSARLTTRCLARLAENGTGLLILSGRQHLPAATLIGQPNGDIALRMAQYALMADETMRAHLARGFVVAKITAQAALLRRAEEARGRSLVLNRAIGTLVCQPGHCNASSAEIMRSQSVRMAESSAVARSALLRGSASCQ